MTSASLESPGGLGGSRDARTASAGECHGASGVSGGVGHVATAVPANGEVTQVRPWRSSVAHRGAGPDTHEGPLDLASALPECGPLAGGTRSSGCGPAGHDGSRTMARFLWPVLVVLLILAVAGPCLTFYLLIKVKSFPDTQHWPGGCVRGEVTLLNKQHLHPLSRSSAGPQCWLCVI